MPRKTLCSWKFTKLGLSFVREGEGHPEEGAAKPVVAKRSIRSCRVRTSAMSLGVYEIWSESEEVLFPCLYRKIDSAIRHIDMS